MPRTIKRGDTYPPLTGTVTDANGNVPLGTADEVKLLCKLDGQVALEFVVTVVNPSATLPNDTDCGKWTYDLDPGDTDDVGAYATEIQVTWNTGVDIQTFPNDPADNDTLTIAQDLGD
jgi:hypothetical protein